MADFKTPNLCGANESLNSASSKIEDLISELDAKVTSAASEAAAAFETKLADVKAGLDALAVDLPASKPINFQSEITSLINNIDRTTVQGLSAYNAKVAQLEQDFGDKLKEKGLELDKLISESSTKLGKDINAVTSALGSAVSDITGAVSSATSSITGAASDAVSSLTGGGTPSLDAFGGAGDAVAGITTPTLPTTGNICDLVPNLEIPANISGTGVTTEEIEERGTYATLTLNQTPKSIVSVTGKKTSQSFFTNIKYTQNGKVIVPTAVGSYSDIKVIYIVDLIQEKPVAAKQADAPPEKEEVSIVTNNAGALESKTTLADITTSYETAPGEEGSVYEKTEKSTPVVAPTGKTVQATTREDSAKVIKTDSKGGKITEAYQKNISGVNKEGFAYTGSETVQATYSINGFTYRINEKSARFTTSYWYEKETVRNKKKRIEWDGSSTLPLPDNYPDVIDVKYVRGETFDEDEDGFAETKDDYTDDERDQRRYGHKPLIIKYGTFGGLDIGRAFGMETPDSFDGEIKVRYRYYSKLNPLNKPK